MARSRNHCYNRNTTARFAYTVELHATVNYMKIFSVAQKKSYGEFLSPEGTKLTWVFIPILRKLGVSQQTFIKVPYI